MQHRLPEVLECVLGLEELVELFPHQEKSIRNAYIKGEKGVGNLEFYDEVVDIAYALGWRYYEQTQKPRIEALENQKALRRFAQDHMQGFVRDADQLPLDVLEHYSHLSFLLNNAQMNHEYRSDTALAIHDTWLSALPELAYRGDWQSYMDKTRDAEFALFVAQGMVKSMALLGHEEKVDEATQDIAYRHALIDTFKEKGLAALSHTGPAHIPSLEFALEAEDYEMAIAIQAKADQGFYK